MYKDEGYTHQQQHIPGTPACGHMSQYYTHLLCATKISHTSLNHKDRVQSQCVHRPNVMRDKNMIG